MARLLTIPLIMILLVSLPSCVPQADDVGQRDQFVSRMSFFEFAGYSAGHSPGKTSEFKLTLQNPAGSRWRGEYCVFLVDRQGVVLEITERQFDLASGGRLSATVPVTFPTNLPEGAYGLALLVPDRSESVTTIWVGEEENGKAGPWPSILAYPSKLTAETSRKLAEDFIRQEPTFVFDGIDKTLTYLETRSGPKTNSWTFVFRFQSRQSGYGDRTGQNLLQVITPHVAVMTIERGRVKTAVMDGKWDMITQKLLTDG